MTPLAAFSSALVLIGAFQGAFLSLSPTAEAATHVVTPGSLNDWAFQVEGTASGSLVNGPATPPMGSGSLRMATGSNGDSGVQFRNDAFHATPLDDVTSMRYSTYVSNNSGCQAPYLILNIDNDNNGSIDDLLFFEPCYQTGAYGTTTGSTVPNQGTVTLNTWQQWNALTGGWWANSSNVGGPPLTTLAAYEALHPNARIINSAAGSGGVRITAGFGAPSWNDFVGYADAFTIGVNGTEHTYDFETGSATTPATCGDAYADRVVSFNQGNQKNGGDVAATRSMSGSILGAPNSSFTTLGFSGSIVLAFDNTITNGTGADVRVYESTIAVNYPLERAHVRASQDGTVWTDIGIADNSDNCNCHQNTTELELGALPWAKYIMLTDATNPALHSSASDAIDINSVQALHSSCQVPNASSSSSSLSSSQVSSSSVSSSSVSSSSLSSSSVSFSSPSSSSVSSNPVTGTRPSCGGMPATVYVLNGMIVGGSDDGEEYDGVLRGGNGDDVIVGTSGDDELYGRSGNDVICGGAGNDELDGGNGRDRLAGESGNDELEGSNASDLLCGQGGNDELDAGNSQDELDGGDGTDTLDGGTSQDACRNGEDNDDCESSGGGAIAACATLLSTAAPVSSASSISSSGMSSMLSSSSAVSSSLNSSSMSSALSSLSSVSSVSSLSSVSSSASSVSSTVAP